MDKSFSKPQRRKPLLAPFYKHERRQACRKTEGNPMTHPFFTTAAAVTLALAVTSPSLAKGGPGAAFMDPERFDLIDADKDAKLSKSEMAADRSARFGAADTDKDGKLSVSELIAVHAEHAADKATKRADKMMARMDDDGDGALTLAEMMPGKRADKMFARIDADEDDALSKDELQTAREFMKKRGMHGDGATHE
jgi:Ca2+-binding EF-hand superfamily protein